jgi:Tfp pilus assembly protein PilF
MKKQEFTTSQERKMKFAEAGILFALVLALTVFIGAKVVTRGDADITDESITTVVTESVDPSVIAAEHPAEIAAVAEPESVVIEPAPIPEPIIVTYAMAEGAYLDRDYAEAARLFNVYTADHTTNAWGHYMLGLSEWKAGNLDASEEAFITALEIKPDHRKSLVNYGRVLIALDRPADARVQIELAIAADPESSDARRVLGRIQHASGELDGAAENYLAVLDKRGDDAWSLNNLGLIRIEQGQYAEALAPLAKAASLQPETACIMNNLGVALERAGYFGDAARAFEAALEADEDYAKAEISLARVEEQEEAHGSESVDLIALAESFTAVSTVAAAEEAGTDLQAGDMEVADAAAVTDIDHQNEDDDDQ